MIRELMNKGRVSEEYWKESNRVKNSWLNRKLKLNNINKSC